MGWDANMIEDWVKEELKDVDIGDKRLDKRLMMLVSAMAKNPEASIPLACESHAATKAAYRFFDDARVESEDICSSHIQSTAERVKNSDDDVLLVIQDTTDFGFTHHPGVEGLGHLNNTYLKGLKMHSGLAVNQDGVPQGLLHLLIWTRDKKKIGKSVNRRQKKTEEKESIRWLDVVKSVRELVPDGVDVVHVADREADIFDLFACAQKHNSKILIRAVHNRCVAHEDRYLWDAIQKSPIHGYTMVDIGRANDRKPRTAKLSIRYETMCISPPKNRPDSSSLYSVPVNIILAKEGKTLSHNEKPLCWLLITTMPIENLDDALRYIEWYSFRWLVERFHYVLKSGCKIEDLQLEKMERLRRAIATYCIVAWRILQITYEARKNPEILADTVLEKHEWKALYCITHKTTVPPGKPPTLHEAVRWIAQLGGFLGRKSDGEPGVKTIWRGFRKLYNYAEMWQLFQPNVPLEGGTCG